SSYALNFVGISEGQELNISVVDAEPYLDLYELARFLVGAEPLSIAFYGAFQLGDHREHIVLTIRLIIKSRMSVILHPHDQEQWVDASQTRLAKARPRVYPASFG